jgi:hypothetical protein
MRFKNIGAVLLSLLLVSSIGCLKEEYSYEGGAVPPVDSTDTTSITDTTETTNTVLKCTLCQPATTVPSMHWLFMYNGVSALCGRVTKAVLSPEKNAMTFFGPSACSIDTGLIMTVFFDTLLNQDRENVRAARAVLQYYIKNSADDVFHSLQPDVTLIVDRFVQETKTATGHFNGSAFTPSGTRVSVESGIFNITFQ